MKQKTLIVIIFAAVAGLAVIGGAALLIVRSQDSSQNGQDTSTSQDSTTDTSSKYPKMEIKITDYPTYIENDCQRVTFKATVKNVGTADLNYSDITSGTYLFLLTSQTPDGKTLVVGSTSDSYISVTGLGDIKVGESREITVQTGKDYTNTYTGATQHDNHISRGTDGNNGDFNLAIGFRKHNADDTYTGLGESERVKVTIEVYEDPSQNLLKSCE